jgi:hypothetical protein
MVDAFSRWCLFCDAEFHAGARNAPRIYLGDYVGDIVHRSITGQAYRLHDRETRISRVADARIIDLPSGSRGLAMVVTLGDQRGAIPAFLHFQQGHSREAERRDGEVKGISSHCVIELDEHPEHVGRHRMVIEESRGLGRTPVTLLLRSLLREISQDRGERFRNPDTGGNIMLRPVIDVWPQQSRQMEEALERGTFGMVELYDTRRPPEWDEMPEFRVERRILRVRVQPADGRIREAFSRLGELGRARGYSMMRVAWRLPGGDRGTSELRTDLEDLGTALLSRRELIEVERPMAECTHTLNAEFVSEIAAHFV